MTTIPFQFRALLEILTPDEAANAADAVAMVHAILANRTARWLLVFDNVGDPTMLRGLLPAAGGGDIIITSQASSWPDHDLNLRVASLTTPDAISLLTLLSGDHDLTSAKALAEELGGLPLALAQAGSYVDRNPISLAGYLELYQKRRTEMHREGGVPDYDQTVATTWQLAFDQLPEPARVLLNLLCWWSPDAIPLHMLLAPDRGPMNLPEEIADNVTLLVTDDLWRNRAISALGSYSLITPIGSKGEVNVHRLVQAVTADQPGVTADPWAIAAARLLNRALPQPPASRAGIAAWNLLRTHGYTVLRYLPDMHPTGLALRANLANWTGEAGDAGEARNQYAALLPDQLRVYGPDHPDTLSSPGFRGDWISWFPGMR